VAPVLRVLRVLLGVVVVVVVTGASLICLHVKCGSVSCFKYQQIYTFHVTNEISLLGSMKMFMVSRRTAVFEPIYCKIFPGNASIKIDCTIYYKHVLY
jgi:hypothetical protein